MIVSFIRLKNWRNFQNVEVKLRERMFLAGPNPWGLIWIASGSRTPGQELGRRLRVTQLPQHRHVSCACQAVALSRGSSKLTSFSYSMLFFRMSSGVYQDPSCTLLKYHE